MNNLADKYYRINFMLDKLFDLLLIQLQIKAEQRKDYIEIEFE